VSLVGARSRAVSFVLGVLILIFIVAVFNDGGNDGNHAKRFATIT
jgi:hypothetical protein